MGFILRLRIQRLMASMPELSNPSHPCRPYRPAWPENPNPSSAFRQPSLPLVSVFAHPPELYLSPRWSPGAEQTEASFPWACRARLAFPQILLIRGAPPLVDCVPQSDRRLEYS